MKKKKIITVALAVGLALSMSLTAFAAKNIFVDLEEVITDTPPQIVNDRTMVPLRAITEMIGCRVEWIGDKQQVEVYEKESATPFFIMNIGSTTAFYTKYIEEIDDTVGTEAIMDSPPILINDRTFVPLRIISEAIGYTVDYNVDSADVYMFSPRYINNQIGEGIGQSGEGNGETQELSDKEINYVLSFMTKSWLSLSKTQKENVITIIGNWWNIVDAHVVMDYNQMLQDLDHQMETYSRNGVDASLFETACDIYEIDIGNYIKG